QLLHELQQQGQPFAGVVHLWSLDSETAENLDPTRLSADLRLTCGSVLNLVQAIAKAQLSVPPRLWLVSRGAVGAGSAGNGVTQASLWGMARTLEREHPELNCTRIDLDPTWDLARADGWRSLFAELNGSDREREIALRSGQRFVARLSADERSDATHTRLQLPEDLPFQLHSKRL
ncbi:MAG: hypothetical protein AAFY15_09085, partial [Cyanobacteria bacterium J06648_11]